MIQSINSERTSEPVREMGSFEIGRVDQILRLYASHYEGKCSRESPLGGLHAGKSGVFQGLGSRLTTLHHEGLYLESNHHSSLWCCASTAYHSKINSIDMQECSFG
ncbi:hypothetical protein FPOAC2_12478 [Fusarium poae]